MGNKPTAFKQNDVTRAVKGAEKAGMAIERVEIEPDGTIVLISGSGIQSDLTSMDQLIDDFQ